MKQFTHHDVLRGSMAAIASLSVTLARLRLYEDGECNQGMIDQVEVEIEYAISLLSDGIIEQEKTDNLADLLERNKK